jgi:hypothetical protein
MHSTSPTPQPNEGPLATRRRFLAGISSAAAAAWIGLGREAAGQQDAAGQAGLPMITLGEHRVSRLMAGSNTILGYSYLGAHTNQQMKEYFTPERTVAFLRQCEEAGINTHQFSTPHLAEPYIRPLREQGSKMKFICLHSQRDKIDEAVELAAPIAMVHHGGATDRLFKEGQVQRVHDYCKAVHDHGMLAGVSAHNPDCIKRVADEDWEVDLFMNCFYFITRKNILPDVEMSTIDIAGPFFKDDPQVMTAVMRQVKQPCLGFKILGAGRLCSNQDTVRAAFKFAFENIKPIDGVIVGMFPWYFDEVGANADYTRQLGVV